LGTLSAPRFRSVLSHKIYHCELSGLSDEPKGVSRFRPITTGSIYFADTLHISSYHVVWRGERRANCVRQLTNNVIEFRSIRS